MFGGAIRIYMQCSTDPPRSHGQNMRASLISPSARVRVAYDYRSLGPFTPLSLTQVECTPWRRVIAAIVGVPALRGGNRRFRVGAEWALSPLALLVPFAPLCEHGWPINLLHWRGEA